MGGTEAKGANKSLWVCALPDWLTSNRKNDTQISLTTVPSPKCQKGRLMLLWQYVKGREMCWGGLQGISEERDGVCKGPVTKLQSRECRGV